MFLLIWSTRKWWKVRMKIWNEWHSFRNYTLKYLFPKARSTAMSQPALCLNNTPVKNNTFSRAYQNMLFFENSGAVFYFMHKCLEKSRKKISGDLRVIWPPQQTVIFYIGKSVIKYRKFHKTRKLAVSLEFQMHLPFQIVFSHGPDLI